jgi:hypothetical protein
MFKTLLTIALGLSISFAGAQNSQQDSVMTPDPDKAGLFDCRINFPDGRARAVGKMQNGKKEGLWRFYDTKGKIELLEEFEADVRNGLHLHFNETVTLKMRNHIVKVYYMVCAMFTNMVLH